MKQLLQIICILFVQNVFAQKSNIINDDFSSNINNWKLEDSDRRLIKIENGQLIIKTTANHNAWVNLEVMIDQKKDFMISTNLTQTSGVKNSGFGLVFGGLDGENYYYFSISSSNFFHVSKVEKNVIVPIKAWTKSDSINGIGISNKLQIKRIKGNFYFYINDNLVFSGPSMTFFGSKYGFINYSPEKEIKVDDFIIEYIEDKTSTNKSGN
jgi:hypothetical protein